MILKDILPENWRHPVERIGDGLNELRLRVGSPVRVVFGGKIGYLSETGFSRDQKTAFIATHKNIDDALFLACDKSVYAFNDNIIKGFLTLADGCRIGVCGRVVKEADKIIALRDVSSLNVRIPHFVRGCAAGVFEEVCCPLKSVLVIAPPGAGKTTFLRDLVCRFDMKPFNLLVADERNELACVRDGTPYFPLGGSVDVFANADKDYAFECGIRTMSPDIIVCDELFGSDADKIETCVASGVKLFASVHADNIEGAKARLGKRVVSLFERFVVLSKKNRPGEIVKVCGRDEAL